MDDLQRTLGERIRLRRRRLGLTQQVLAEQAGFAAHQIVSQIENGTREVKAWELAAISKALLTDIRKLLEFENKAENPVLVWRDYRNGDAVVKEAAFLQRCERYHQLEEWLDMGPSRELPQVDIDARDTGHDDLSRIAIDISKTLDLGSIPAASLASVLENDYAVKIWYEDLDENGSAASAFGDFGYGILMHSRQPPWRRNLSFAHELFHLITRDCISTEEAAEDKGLYENVERLADSFAGMLLLPVDSLCSEFDRRKRSNGVKYSDAVEMARRFQVSTAALLWGLVGCGRLEADRAREVLADPAFRERDRMSMPSHWWQPPEMPERFVSLAFLAHQKGRMSRARLATYLEVSLPDLPAKLAKYGLAESDELEGDVSTA